MGLRGLLLRGGEGMGRRWEEGEERKRGKREGRRGEKEGLLPLQWRSGYASA